MKRESEIKRDLKAILIFLREQDKAIKKHKEFYYYKSQHRGFF